MTLLRSIRQRLASCANEQVVHLRLRSGLTGHGRNRYQSHRGRGGPDRAYHGAAHHRELLALEEEMSLPDHYVPWNGEPINPQPKLFKVLIETTQGVRSLYRDYTK